MDTIESSYAMINESAEVSVMSMKQMVVTMQKQRTMQKKSTEDINNLFSQRCIAVEYSTQGSVCKTGENAETCVQDVTASRLSKPMCLEYQKQDYVKTPQDGVRAIYMSSYVASNKSFRKKLVDLVDQSELNTIVIDVKEVEGYVNYAISDTTRFPYQRNLMFDIEDFIKQLHNKNIYVIGRIVVFKDGQWVRDNPGDAVQKKSDPGTPWEDFNGKTFVDPGARDYWDYIVAIADNAHKLGFDEINFDYIRYPSDGNVANILYPQSGDVLSEYGLEKGRSMTVNDFSQYITRKLRELNSDIVMSGDVFGMVSTARNDVTIGQRLEPMLLAYDYISPMVYPSHYPMGFLNLSGHPDLHPYEVVNRAQQTAQERMIVLQTRLLGARQATTTAALQDILGTYTEHKNTNIQDVRVGALRPWLQDFTCTWCQGSKPYGAAEVQAQIQATNDAGQQGWMLWDAGNRYRGYREI